MQSTPSPPRTLEPKWLRVTAGCAPKEPQSHFPTHHISPLTVQFMLELLPGDPKHRLTPVPAAYAVNRDLYAWQTGMPPEACARESEAHERPYGASVRALEELAPCRRKQGRHRSFPSPSFSSCLAQIHSAEPSGNLGHLNALPSWPPSPGPCAPVRAPQIYCTFSAPPTLKHMRPGPGTLLSASRTPIQKLAPKLRRWTMVPVTPPSVGSVGPRSL